MAEAAAVAAENNEHSICCFERCLFVQNLLLLLLSLLPGCPGSCILLLLLTERHSFKIGFHFILNNWQCRRLLTEHTAGSIGGRRCSQGQGWDKARWSNCVWFKELSARFGHLVAAAGGPAVAPGDGEGAPGQLPPGAPPPGAWPGQPASGQLQLQLSPWCHIRMYLIQQGLQVGWEQCQAKQTPEKRGWSWWQAFVREL